MTVMTRGAPPKGTKRYQLESGLEGMTPAERAARGKEARAEVPREGSREVQVQWLFDWWQRIDEWIARLTTLAGSENRLSAHPIAWQTSFQEAKLQLLVKPHVTADGSVSMHVASAHPRSAQIQAMMASSSATPSSIRSGKGS